jgi:hypothetical protein
LLAVRGEKRGFFERDTTAMKKTSAISFATATSIAALFAASSAFAAQNVANTSQKGSLLIWPLITTDTSSGEYGPQDTFVELSNDANSSIHVECEYVNEEKGRVNFDFELTGKQTASWDVGTQNGDEVVPPPFPTNAGSPPFPGDPHRGELVCFATNQGRQYQVAWNELTGSATVMNLSTTSASQPKQGFKYNAWAFAARNSTGLAPDKQNMSQGTPGTLVLSGANAAGAYDACPLYNTANFMPNGATLGNVTTIKNDLAVVGCNQDLREQYQLHLTKLDFTVWNSHENSFTGAYYCTDSVETVTLNAPPVTAGTNFNYSTLQTPDARFQVDGISASPPCSFSTQATGLLGVVEASTSIAGDPGSDALIGSTTQGAGIEPGFVDWDPSGSTPPSKR